MKPELVSKGLICAAVLFWCCGILFASEQVVHASSFGFDPVDSTAILQRAIDSGAAKVVVDKVDGIWHTGPLRLRSGLELVIADGVTVQALKGAFKAKNECLFSARKVKDLTIRGSGKAILRMNKADYQQASLYQRSEWRHLLAFYSVENVVIRDLHLLDSGGDGIYLGSDSDLTPNRNVKIDNVVSCGHHRQGISVISADGLHIRNSRFCCTKGTAPSCGIDIEPNYPDEIIRNVLIEDCHFNNNDNCGILLHMQAFSKPSSVVIRNCRSYANNNCGLSVYSHPLRKTAGGTILIERCRFEDNLDSAMILNNQFAGGQKITFRDCVFDNRRSGNPVLLIFNNSQMEVDAGGVEFAGDNKWYSDSGEKLYLHMTKAPGQKIGRISGKVTVIDSMGKSHALQIR